MRWTSVERPNDPRALELVKRFAITAKHWEYVSNSEVSSGDVILAVGGDGTAMTAMRLSAISGARILAVHGGTLGFLADISPEEMDEIPQMVESENFAEDERILLEYIDSRGNSHLAANEIVISDECSGSPHNFSFDIGSHSSGRFAADALIIATPTGSTAYAMSSGGPIIHPHSRTFSMTAVAPMTLSFRPVCVPCTRDIVLYVSGRKASSITVKADIMECEKMSIGKDEVFSFKVAQSQKTAIFLRKRGWDFFDTLSKKLGWATVPGLPQ